MSIAEDEALHFVVTTSLLHSKHMDVALADAYKQGRCAPPTDTEITAAAKYLKANPELFGPSACFIDPNRFGEIARGVLQAARTALQVH